MLYEISRAVICALIAIIGIYGAVRADWRVLRFILALFVVWIMAGEVWGAVNAAATHVSDMGNARKVGFLSIAAGVIALWCAPAWLASKNNGRA